MFRSLGFAAKTQRCGRQAESPVMVRHVARQQDDPCVTDGGVAPAWGNTYPRLMVRVIPHAGLPVGVTWYCQVSVVTKVTLPAFTPQSLI